MYVLPIITFLLWGSLYTVSKDVMTQVPPLTLLLFRYLTACVFLYPVFRFTKGKLPAIESCHLELFGGIGLVGYGLAIALQQVSTDMLDASLATLINATNPIFICILAFFLLKESITKEQILGILLAIIGIYLVLGVFILQAPITKGFLIGTLVISAGILLSLIRVPLWPFRHYPCGKRR